MSNECAQGWLARAASKRTQCEKLVPPGWKLPSAIITCLTYPLEASKNNLIELDIPRRSGILTEKELRITEAYDVRRLLKALASGELSSLETSCLTEALFEQAQERARVIDALRERGQLAGPLHGLPVSLKDSFQVRGTDATLGLIAYLDNGPSQENSCLVEVLLSLGAVPFCKTNVPQTLMTADSHNNIFGRTLNPWNTSLTAGGSTGGEGALIAFRGSPLGIGTDVGEDPLFPWHPPIKGAVADVANLLRAQGHDIVYLTSQQCLIGQGYDVASQIFGLDKTAAQLVKKSGEPLVPSMLYIREAVRGVKFDRSFLPDTRTIKDGLDRLSVLNVKRSEIQEAWRKVWEKYRLDAVIGPGAQNTAVEHDMYALAPYTCLFNLLDYPACVIPVGRVKIADSGGSFTKSPGQFAPPYNPDNLNGAPTAIQVITTRMRDEECLAVARLIDEYVRSKIGDMSTAARL
ncbi:Acetamidase [Cytospora mali]|uniref:Acetamidase n=1 Tax=Cytospora mali TaxID=578113 RepID=A0A194VH31_CYTMA|nr:Acetamidase [Valsa mali var. pyri (nom. inval.)]